MKCQKKKEYEACEKCQSYLNIANELKSLVLSGLQSQNTERICRYEHRTPVIIFENHGVHNGNKREREVKALTIQERRKWLIMDYADR